MNFLKLQKVYVILWDAWNFRCVFGNKQDAMDYIDNRMFSSMYEIREVTINDVQGENTVNVLLAEREEFLSICPDDGIDWAGEDQTIREVTIR